MSIRITIDEVRKKLGLKTPYQLVLLNSQSKIAKGRNCVKKVSNNAKKKKMLSQITVLVDEVTNRYESSETGTIASFLEQLKEHFQLDKELSFSIYNTIEKHELKGNFFLSKFVKDLDSNTYVKKDKLAIFNAQQIVLKSLDLSDDIEHLDVSHSRVYEDVVNQSLAAALVKRCGGNKEDARTYIRSVTKSMIY